MRLHAIKRERERGKTREREGEGYSNNGVESNADYEKTTEDGAKGYDEEKLWVY